MYIFYEDICHAVTMIKTNSTTEMWGHIFWWVKVEHWNFVYIKNGKFRYNPSGDYDEHNKPTDRRKKNWNDSNHDVKLKLVHNRISCKRVATRQYHNNTAKAKLTLMVMLGLVSFDVCLFAIMLRLANLCNTNLSTFLREAFYGSFKY